MPLKIVINEVAPENVDKIVKAITDLPDCRVEVQDEARVPMYIDLQLMRNAVQSLTGYGGKEVTLEDLVKLAVEKRIVVTDSDASKEFNT